MPIICSGSLERNLRADGFADAWIGLADAWKGADFLNSIQDIWNMVLDRMRTELYETTINTWFDEVTPVAVEGDTLILHCPNDFKRSTIEDRFLGNIAGSMKDIFSADFTIRVLSDAQLQAYNQAAPEEQKPKNLFESDEFTFENFVVGPSNKLAFAAAKAVAAQPAEHYNPLFIYGDSGLGKTHLIYSIAHEIRQKCPAARIVYIKGDEFINEFIEAVRTGRNQDFRVKYREADLLLVDDIQFVAGKEETQNEFFHTFNTLYESRRQIVLTSDRPPQEMSRLDDRLRTRFEWGLLVDVQPPDLETRIAIVKNKAAQLGLLLSDDVVGYIAKNVTSNVRLLEGTVKKIKAFRDLLGSELDGESVDRAIHDMLRKENEFIPSPDTIIAEICKYYRIDDAAIRGQQRDRNIVRGRQVAMYLIRRMSNYSYKDIGKEFGDRDHTTVMHSIEQVEQRMKKDSAFAETVRDITTNINAKK